MSIFSISYALIVSRGGGGGGGGWVGGKIYDLIVF